MERCYEDTHVPNASQIWHVEMNDVCLFSETALPASKEDLAYIWTQLCFF